MLRRRRSSTPDGPVRPSGVQLRAALAAMADGAGFDEAAFLESCTTTFLVAQRAWTERDPDLTRDVMLPGIWEDHRRQIEAFREQGRRNVIDELAIDDLQIVAAANEDGADHVTVRFFARCADYDVDVTGPEPTIVRGTTKVEEWAEDWVFSRPVGGGPWLLDRIDQLTTYEDALATLPDPDR